MSVFAGGAAMAAAAAGAVPLQAQTAENVLVVINQESGISRQIGEYYAERRNIPGKNLCRISTTEQEEISRQVYEHDIEAPVGECLKQGDLKERILYIVTTTGVPLKISGLGGPRGNAASVDSELTLLYERLDGESPSINGPQRNPFFGKLAEPFNHDRFPIYLVTRLTGYSFEDVRGMVDRSLRAKNRGTFVVDMSSAGHDDGNQWLRSAAQALPQDRVKLETTPQVLYSEKNVIAYASWGTNDERRVKEGRRRLDFQWLPGAIATEYVSTNARTFRKPPDSWTFGSWHDSKAYFGGSPQDLTADFIADGATGASGHVYEPYLQFTPRPQFLLPAYYAGRTLAESFYLAIPALSWMNVVVGDPLCRLGPPPRH